MQTLKTAIVVVLLLVVFYGVYEMLNRPPVEDPPDIAGLPPEVTEEPDIQIGDLTDPSGGFGSSDGLETYGSLYDDGGSVPQDPNVSFPIPDPSTPANPGAGTGTDTGSYYQPPPSIPGETVDSTAAPPQPPTTPSQIPRADSSVVAIPGGPGIQHNPFVNEDPVPKPTLPNSDPQQLGARAYQRALKTAESLMADGDYARALTTLSVFYKSGDLTPEQHRQLVDLLDPLAGRVIYSREHLLERPYRVRGSETLMDVAQQYNVPYVLLQKINGIENPQILLPGSELKVLRGPFRAEVDKEGQELTLFLDRLYAGRFPISLGVDPAPIEGEFQIREKRPGKAYFSMGGQTLPAENPANPFGSVWLDLGRQDVCIHGSPAGGVDQNRGCISLSPRDAEDVYSILSVGSKVRILR